MDITTYRDDQIEPIEARNLQPGHWLIRKINHGNEAIYVEDPVHVLDDIVIAFSTITHSFSDFSFENSDQQCNTVWFDQTTGAFQCLKIEMHYHLNELLAVLKSEFAPPAPEEA